MSPGKKERSPSQSSRSGSKHEAKSEERLTSPSQTPTPEENGKLSREDGEEQNQKQKRKQEEEEEGARMTKIQKREADASPLIG